MNRAGELSSFFTGFKGAEPVKDFDIWLEKTILRNEERVLIQACSHLVISTKNVEVMKDFFSSLFAVQPHFYNPEFCEFVLPSRFRVAFFKPVGKAALFFGLPQERTQVSYGVTVVDVEATYQTALRLNYQVSGAPKEHSWGEKSFLVVDPENNRWEIAQSPSQDGMLVNLNE